MSRAFSLDTFNAVSEPIKKVYKNAIADINITD